MTLIGAEAHVTWITGREYLRSDCQSLTGSTETDSLSDMKTFMVRELSRQTARVLETCEQEGGVIIEYQDGRQFHLIPRVSPAKVRRHLPDFAGRQRAVFGNTVFSAAQLDTALSANKGAR